MRKLLLTLFLLVFTRPVLAQNTTIPVVATDGMSFVRCIPAAQLSIKVDGQEQKVLNTRCDEQAPLYIAVLMEYSRSLPTSPYAYLQGWYYPYQDVVYEEGMVINELSMRMGDEDRIALATYGQSVHLLEGFTQNRQQILGDLEDMLNSPVGPEDALSTPYSSIDETLHNLSSTSHQQRIILVVVAAGVDDMGIPYEDVLQSARSLGIQVFYIRVGWNAVQDLQRYADESRITQSGLFNNEDTDGQIENKYYLAASRIRYIALASGGQGYEIRFPEDSPGIAEDIFYWAHYTTFAVFQTPELNKPGKLYKIQASFLGDVLLPGQKKFKPHVYTVDGLRIPKVKKAKHVS
jgi:hypothetical protein